jgi:hypothetical protein
MPTTAEKLGFLMMGTVGIRQKMIINRRDLLLVSILG